MSLKRHIALTFGILLLILSWAVLFWAVDLMFVEVLTPYSSMMREARPSPGTWRRELNDFFERNGIFVPILIVGGSVGLFVVALARVGWKESGRLILRFTLSNVGIAAGMLLSTPLVAQFPSIPSPEYPSGYEGTYKFIIAVLFFLGLLFFIQGRGVKKAVASRGGDSENGLAPGPAHKHQTAP